MLESNLNKKLTISVVIVAYNEERYISKCLETVMKYTDGYVDEILVVDNNSTDKTAEIAQRFNGVKVVSERIKGVTHARQKGYKESKGDIIVFLDADIQMQQGYFEEVYSIFVTDNNVGFLSGPYSYYDANRFHQLICKCYWLFSYFFMYKCFGYLGVGGNMILRRTTLDKMQGFDTNIIFYGDDTDTARRAKQLGKVVFDMKLIMPTSFRRFHGQGKIYTIYIYFMNAFYEIFFHKPYSTSFKSYR